MAIGPVRETSGLLIVAARSLFVARDDRVWCYAILHLDMLRHTARVVLEMEAYAIFHKRRCHQHGQSFAAP